MVASACLTLAAIHLLIWCQRRTARASLVFSLPSRAVAALSACGFCTMRAETPAQFATDLRWFHMPGGVLIVSLVGFARLHLRAGRPWLGWTVCGLRTLWSLALLPSLLAIDAEAAPSTFRGDPDYLIDTWDTEEGWPGFSAYTMAQTPDGYLWMGTPKGLVRFDGMEFRVFDPSSVPQLPHPAIMKLHLDRSGRLWAGTVRGLAVRSGAEWRTMPLPGPDNNRGNHLVRSLAERGNGDLLVTTADGGVLEFHAGQFHALPPPPGATNAPYQGGADDAGNWWVAQNKFIGMWDGQGWVETVSLAGVTNLLPRQVGLAPGRTGGLWLLLGSELRHYRGATEASRLMVPGLKGDDASLMEDSQGRVWIGTARAGLWQVSSNLQVRHWSPSNGLPDDTVHFAFEDRQKNLWVGLGHGGLARFQERTFRSVVAVTNRLVFARFALAAAPTGGVFIASYQRGLWRADAEGLVKVALPKPFNASFISGLSLLADHAGCIWIGALSNGVWRIEGQNARWMPIDASGRAPARKIFEDSRGRIWLAGGESVSVFEAGEMRGFGPAQGLTAVDANALAEDKTGTIWLAHERGVFRLVTNRWVEVIEAGGRALRMSGLRADADGAMWMASINTGISRWQEGRLLHRPLPPELPMRGVYTIVEDPLGWFWMTSNQGVLRARKSEVQSWLEGKQAAVAWQVFGVSDGLPAMDCADIARDERARLWFTTARGVAWTDPAAEHPNPTPPPVQIEELTYHRAAPRVYGGEAAGAKAPPVQSRLQWPFPAKLTLPPGSRRLQVHFAALDFTAPENLRYQIQLQPGDTDWQDIGRRRVVDY